jgi:hypothetical protein
MSSRLLVDNRGRLVVEGVLLDVRGLRWLVVDQYAIFEPRGRPPTARERAEAREPYQATRSPAWLLRNPENDRLDDLDDTEAIRAAMLEQRRQPPDLVNVAA